MKVSALPHCGMLCIIAAVTCLAYDVPALLDAVKRRDHKTLKTLIKARADVNVAQPDGATALAWAIYLDDQEAAEMLLAAGRRSTRRTSTAKRRSRWPAASRTPFS